MPGMLVLRFSSIAQQHSLPALLGVREKRERLLQALQGACASWCCGLVVSMFGSLVFWTG